MPYRPCLTAPGETNKPQRSAEDVARRRRQAIARRKQREFQRKLRERRSVVPSCKPYGRQLGGRSDGGDTTDSGYQSGKKAKATSPAPTGEASQTETRQIFERARREAKKARLEKLIDELYRQGVKHQSFWVPNLYMKQEINRKLKRMGF